MGKLITEPLYSLADISTTPCIITDIKSRKECKCVYDDSLEMDGRNINKFLPIIVSPMSCNFINGIDDVNIYLQNQVNVVVPRTIPFEKRLVICRTQMTAFSLSETKDILEAGFGGRLNICIDMANGHMIDQINLGKELRNKYKDTLTLMGGNIANPEAYKEYMKAGFNYVRVGIGGGAACLTSTQSSVHTPMASLLDKINKIRTGFKFKKFLYPNFYPTKVIADGGISGYSDIIKCLALGADYVMMGRIFTKAALHGEPIGTKVEYYGMSTKRAQKEMGGLGNKTSEGKYLELEKEYTLSGWVENFRDYLRSAMSYTDCKTLEEFKKNVICQVISPNSSYAINNK